MTNIDPLIGVPVPRAAWPNVVPFTIRENPTQMGTLEDILKWLNKELVPFVNNNVNQFGAEVKAEVDRLVAAWENLSVELIADASGIKDESVAARDLAEQYKDAAEAARDLAERYASEAAGVQDEAIAELIENPASAARIILDGLYVASTTFDILAEVINNGRLSEDALAELFAAKADKEDVEAAIELANQDNAATNVRVSVIEELTSQGRLSQAQLDIRYKRVEDIPHAVFTGSSNATANTWVEDFATRMGYIAHNFSVGGGSFNGTGAGRFDNQLAAAIADNTFDKAKVKYFFLCDVGNDIRANGNVQAAATVVFANAQNAYPNARIIVLPAVWGNAALNNNGTVLNSISMRYAELQDAALDFDRVELIDHSWTWLTGSTTWMRPGEVHPNVAGFARIADFMVKYMHDAPVKYNQGGKYVSPRAGINANTSYWTAARDGNLATIQGNFQVPTAIGVDTELGQLDYGLWPLQSYAIPVTRTSDRAVAGAIIVFENGLIRSFGGMVASNWQLAATHRVF